MGMLRKIEIDDQIPCNKNEEPIIPRCEKWEELWPAIITKAIIKLFSYKFRTYFSVENIIGDIQIIHALTGYFVELCDINKKEIDFKKYFNKIEIINISNEHNYKDNVLNNSIIKSNGNGDIRSNTEIYIENNKSKEKEIEIEKEKFFIMCYNFKKLSDIKKDKKRIEKEEKKLLRKNSYTNVALPILDSNKENDLISENKPKKKSIFYFYFNYY